MIGRTVTGLDLGSWAVKAVELRAGLRAVEVVRAEQMRLPTYASIEEREATVQLFLEQRGFPREFVVTAISADALTQRHLRFPFTAPKQVRQAIRFEIEDELPLDLGQVILAHEQARSSPERTDVLALLAPRAVVELHLQAARRMDLEPRVLEVEGAVLANLANYLALATLCRLALDIGHRKTTLCLLVDGKPAVLRTVPIGGHQLTDALAKDQKLAYDAAEDLKHRGALFKGTGSMPASVHVAAVLDRLAREVMRSLQSVVGDPLDPIAPAEITLCGGSALAPGLAGYLEERAGVKCLPLELPGEGEGFPEELEEVALPSFAHALALALRASNTERVTAIDLRQDEFAYVPDLSGMRGQLQLALGLFGLVLLLWVSSLAAQVWSAGAHADALRAQLRSIYLETSPGETPPPDPARALEAELRETRELANHLGVTGSGPSVLEVLRRLSARIPPALEVGLSELRLERHSLSAKGHSPDFVSVDRVRAELEREPLFREVELSDVVNEPRRGGKSFSLTIRFGTEGE